MRLHSALHHANLARAVITPLVTAVAIGVAAHGPDCLGQALESPPDEPASAQAARQADYASPESGLAPLTSQTDAARLPVPAKVIRYAERLLSERDRDGDQNLDRQEWGRTWGFLTSDANLDGRVSLEELVQRIAAYGRYRRIRLLPPSVEGVAGAPALLNPSTEAAAGGPVPSMAASVANGGEEPADEPADEPDPRRNRKFVPSSVRQPGSLPSWFNSRDADGDGQLSMAEFSPKPTGTSLAEFSRYDRDGDGVITPSEYVRAVKSPGK